MEKKFDDNDEIQIDLLELAYALKKKLWLIILGLIVGAFGAGLYSKILLTPIYKSTAMVYVLSKETTLTSLADLQIGSQLTKDYSVLVTSRRCWSIITFLPCASLTASAIRSIRDNALKSRQQITSASAISLSANSAYLS